MMESQPHRKKLRRYEIPSGLRFLTFSCRHRLPLFDADEIKQAFVERIRFVHAKQGAELIAWVIMPEHVHLLVRPTQAEFPIPSYLVSLKTQFAKQVVSLWRRTDGPCLKKIQDGKGHCSFWKPGGGYDRNIESSAELIEKINYIHLNPVRRDLCEHREDWAWSSARSYMNLPYSGPPITKLDLS